LRLDARRPRGFFLLLLLAACTGGQKSSHAVAVESQVYAQPLDEVLAEATTLLTQKGWHVERSGDLLGTNWRMDATGTALGYRVEGERIDEGHCSIRIEALAASSFAPGGPSGPTPSNSASGGRATNWDGVDAPTTLGEPPPGLVTLPRGRDDALEFALMQRLDPRAAQAIVGADARTHATDAGPSMAAIPSAPGCEPELTGVDALLTERRVILLADVPGTKEIPDFVGRLACQAARKGIPTVVALELLRIDQDSVDTYLASRATAGDRAAFLQAMRSFGPQGSGNRGSKAVLELLDRIRVQRDSGLSIRVILFDEVATASTPAKARAATLERLRRIEPETLLLVLVVRGQARTVLLSGESAESPPLGVALAHWGLNPLALDVRSPGGATWGCESGARGACGIVPVHLGAPPIGAPSISVYPTPDAEGFFGLYAVGPLTPSSGPASSSAIH
jgi:hypothetical protein